jgi:hypothetical protein
VEKPSSRRTRAIHFAQETSAPAREMKKSRVGAGSDIIHPEYYRTDPEITSSFDRIGFAEQIVPIARRVAFLEAPSRHGIRR